MGNKVCCAPKTEEDLRDHSASKPMDKRRFVHNISDKKPRILASDYGQEEQQISPVSTTKNILEKLYDSPKEVSLRLPTNEIDQKTERTTDVISSA